MNPSSVHRYVRVLLIAVIVTGGVTDVAHAATRTKNALTTGLNLPGNWVEAAVPGSGDTALYNNTIGANSTALGASLTFGSIKIADPSGTATIATGNTLTLHANGSLTTAGVGIDMSTATADMTLQCAVALTSNQTWNVATGRTLTQNTAVMSGGGGLTLAGTGGTLSLAGVNTFSGGLTIKSGTVIGLTSATSLGAATSPITLGDTTGSANATVNYNSALTYAQPILVLAGSSGNTLTLGVNASVAVTLSGAVTLRKDVTLTNTGTGTLGIGGGSISGSGNITVNNGSSGAVTLNGSNPNFTGSITITAGTLAMGAATGLNPNNAVAVKAGTTFNYNALATTVAGVNDNAGGGGTVNNSGGAATLTLRGGGAYAFSGVITATTPANGLLTVQLAPGGSQTLSGTSTYTGATTVNSGTLVLDYSTVAGVLAATTLPTVGGGTLKLVGRTGGNVTVQTLGNLTAAAGGGAILIDPNAGTSTTLTLGTLTASVAGGSLLFGTAPGADNTKAFIRITTTAKDATGIYSAHTLFTDGTANGYDWNSTVSGASPFTLSGYAGYAALQLGAGTDTGNSRITTGATVTGARVTNTLKIENPDTLNAQTLAIGANSLALTGGGLLMTGNNSFTISGNAGGTRLFPANGNGVYDLAVHQYNSGGLTISAVIGNNGANPVSVTKAGTGTLVLSGINTFTGALTINSGTLQANTSAAALGAGTVTLAGGTLDCNDASSLFFNRAMTVSRDSTIITEKNAAGAGNTYTFTTLAISGQTLTISGGNVNTGTAGVTFSGTTTETVGGPTFVINNPVGGGTTLLTLGAVTTLANYNTTLKGNGNLAQTGAMSATTGGLVLDASYTGTVTLNQANGFTGQLTVNGGTLRATSVAGALGGTGILQLNAGSNVQLANDTSLTFTRNATQIGGTTTVTVDRLSVAGAPVTHSIGTGTLTINAGGPYTLTVNAGSLVNAAGSGGLTFGGATLFSDATFVINNPSVGGGTTVLTVSTVADNGKTITLQGAGNFTATGIWGAGPGGLILDSTYSGTATLSGANTFAGGVTIKAGTASGTTSAAAFGTGPILLGDASGNANVTLLGSALTFANAITVRAGSSGNTLTIGNSGNSSAVFSGAVTLNNTLTVLAAGTGSVNLSGLIGGAGPLIATAAAGANTITLGNANTFNGGVQLNSGTLNINNSGAGGTSSALGTGTLTISGGTINNTAGATVTISTVNPQLWNGNFTFTGSNPLNLGLGSVTLNATRQVTASANTLTVGGVVDDGGSGYGLTKLGGGTLALTGLNTYSGATTIGGGILSVATLANVNTASGIGKGSAGGSPADLVLNGGTLQLSGAAVPQSTDRRFTLTALGGGLDSSSVTANTMTFADTGAITLSGIGTRTLTLTGSNTGNNTLAGALDNDASLNATSLTKSGAGTWVLSGANAYSGLTTIGAGTLILSGSNSSGGNTTLNGTGTLQLNSASNGGLAGGLFSMGSSVQPINAARVVNNNTLLLNNLTISGAQSLTFQTGTFTQSGGDRQLNNSLSPGTLTFAGNIYLSEASGTGRTLFMLGTGTTVFSGPIANFNGGSGTDCGLTIQLGTVTLSGPSTYSGKTSIFGQGGSVTISSIGSVNGGPSALGNPSSIPNGTIDLGNAANTAILVYVGSGDTSDRVLNLVGTSGGGARIDQSGTGLLKFTSDLTATATGTKTLTLQGSNLAGTGEIAGKIVDTTTAATSVTKSGTGTWTLSNAGSTYTGATTINGGVLEVAALALGGQPSSIGSAGNGVGNLFIGSAGSPGTLRFTGNSTTTSDRGFTLGQTGTQTIDMPNLSSGQTLSMGAVLINNGPMTISVTGTGGGATLILGTVTGPAGQTIFTPTSANLSVGAFVQAGAQNLTLDGTANTNFLGALSSSTAATLTKQNISTWTLTGASHHTGLTTVNQGTLTITGTLDAATGSAVTVGPVSPNSATLNLNNTGAMTIKALTVNGTGTGLVTENSVNALGGTASLTISTAGATVVLSRANNYSGATGLTLGTLELQDAGSVGSSALTLNSGTLKLRNESPTTFTAVSKAIAAGTVTVDVGHLTSATAQTLSLGNINMAAATLNVTDVQGSDYTLGLGTVTITGAVVFNPTSAHLAITTVTGTNLGVTLGGTSTGNTVGTITTGTGTLTKNTASTWTLTGASTFTGNTTISLGTLTVTGTFDQTTGSAVTVGPASPNSATLNLNNTSAMKIKALTVNGTGTGLVTENAANALTGTASLTISTAVGNSGPLSQANNYSGATGLTLGTLELQDAGSVGSSALTLNSGTLKLRNETPTTFAATSKAIAAGTVTVDVGHLTSATAQTLSLGNVGMAAATLNVTDVQGSDYTLGLGTVTITGAVVFNPTSAHLAITTVTGTNLGVTLGGTSTGNTVGTITTGTGTLTKNTASTWTLTGTSTFTGASTISAGTLVLSGALGNTAVAVNGGTLAGGGTISGAVTVNNGGALDPAGTGIGTLTTGALTLNSGSAIAFEVADNAGNNDKIIGNGSGLTVNGGGVYVYAPGKGSGWTVDGTYNLVQYSGTLGGAGPGALRVLNPQPGKYYSFGTSSGWLTLTIGTTPMLTIDSASVTEGNSGQANLTFTIGLSAGGTETLGTPVSVDFVTADGTAWNAAPFSDYVPSNGTAIIPAGSPSVQVVVKVNGDIKYEPDETLTVTLSNPIGGAPIVNAVGTGTILNDDAQAARFVDSQAAGAANGNNWDDAYTSLQTALTATSSGQIWVRENTYKPGALTTQTFNMKNNVAVYGGFAGTESALSQRVWNLHPTFLSGDLLGDDAANRANRTDNSINVITAPDGTDATAKFDGFIITGGNATTAGFGGGGLIIVLGGSGSSCYPTFGNCIFVDNMASGSSSGGGAMYLTGFNGGTRSQTFTNCLFLNNYSSSSGGVLAGDSRNTPIFSKCVFAGNESVNNGSVINISGGTPRTFNYLSCLFAGNYCQSAGNGGVVRLTGGALGVASVMNSCTISRNSAANFAAVIVGDAFGNSLTLQNSICYDDSPGPELATAGIGAINTTYSDISGGWAGTGNILTAPSFATAPAGNWTSVGAYNVAARQTTLTSSGAGWTPGVYVGLTVQPDSTQPRQYVIASNGVQSVTVWGDASAAGQTAAFQMYDYRLTSGSPCKDTGNNTGAPLFDLDGATRPVNTTTDMGAYEYNAPVAITVNTDPPGKIITVDGSAGTAPLSYNWLPGSSHTLASPASLSAGVGTQLVFATWSDAGAREHTITVGAPTTYTASFTTQFLWTATATAGGTVSPTGPSWYNAGSTFLAVASPNVGFVFTGWSGDVTDAVASVTITMTNAMWAVGNFATAGNQYTIRSSPPGLAVVVDGATVFDPPAYGWVNNSIHSIGVAVGTQSGGAGIRYVWQSWTDSGAQTHDVTSTADTTITASFKTQYLWNVTIAPPGGGSVIPVDGTWNNSGSAFTATATPASGYGFSGWSGDLSSPWSTLPVTMSGPVDVTATFIARKCVDTRATGANNGTSWADAYTDLQTALASGASQFWVAEGTYLPGVTRASTFAPGSGRTLYGGFAGTESAIAERVWRLHPTILSGDINGDDTGNWGNRTDNVRHVITAATSFTLDGFVIAGGDCDVGTGGGGLVISASTASPTIRNCTFTGNRSTGLGGAVLISAVDPDDGVPYTKPLFKNCKFSDNLAVKGGGVYFGRNWPRFDQCVFAGNYGGDSGGGAYISPEKNGGSTFTNCLFAGNSALNMGGAVDDESNGSGSFPHASRIVNCTFSGNAAPSYGAILFNGTGGSLTIVNCISYGDTVGEIGKTGGGAWSVTYTDVQGGSPVAGTGNINADPQFVVAASGQWSTVGAFDRVMRKTTLTASGAGWTPGAYAGLVVNADISQSRQFVIASNGVDSVTVWGDATQMAANGDNFQINNYHITSGSPCQNSGLNASAPAYDLDSVARPQFTTTDMGAYEYVLPVNVNINTAPAGLVITFDGNALTAPQTLSWLPGTTHSLGVPEPQSGTPGNVYTFGSWSQGGAREQELTISAGTNLTATMIGVYDGRTVIQFK